MKLELKKIKHYPSRSEETENFTAEIWINDKLIAHADNDGRGGSTRVHAVDRKDPLFIEAEKWAESIPHDFSFPNSLDQLVDVALARALQQKEISKYFSKNIVWSENVNDPNSIMMSNWGNFTIAQLLSDPGGVRVIQKKVDEIKSKGFKLLNTNLGSTIKM